MSALSVGETVHRRLARLVHAVGYDDLGPDAVRAAKQVVLDSIGCVFGGFAGAPAAATRAVAHRLGGRPEATIFGTGIKTSMALAAFANGTALRYLDFNDVFSGRRDTSHPSGNLPGALAVAEAEGRSGRDLIAAIVAAYELQSRLCDNAGVPNLKKRGWHHTCNLQFSSAAAAALLLSDDPEITANALAISGTHQNTLAQIQHGRIATIKATADGWIAKAAVEAALLALEGVGGPDEIFEGTAGWGKVVAGGADFEAMLAPAQGFRIVEVRFKPFAAVGPAAAPIQAAVDLHATGKVPIDRIKRVEIQMPGDIVDDPAVDEAKRYPANRETADHSFYYCVAMGLMEGDVGEAQYAPEKLTSPRVRALLSTMSMVADPEFTAGRPEISGGGVRVTLDDGSVHERRHPVQPGHPRNPLTDDQLAAKFRRQLAPLFPAARIDAIQRAVMGLEDCADVAEFAALLAKA